MPLFDFHNPNRDILKVEGEEGSDASDKMNAMIGDAVANHVMKLNDSQRLVWESVILMGNDNIFEVVPSFNPNDHDPLNLAGEDLETLLKDKDIKEEDKWLYKEAIEIEKERRDKSEDVLDKRDHLISYEEWKNNPGLGSYVDIPKTPRNKTRYLGNINQCFYDDFPEGHPDSKVINDILYLLNKEPEELTKSLIKYIHRRLDTSEIKCKYVFKFLSEMIDEIDTSDKSPDEIISNTLKKIDTKWSRDYRNESLTSAKQDKFYQLFLVKNLEWKQKQKNGLNLAPEIKAFGKTLYRSFNKEMTNHHWSWYQQFKKKYSPKVIIGGVDINRAGLSAIQIAMDIDKNTALKVWFGRPWSNEFEVQNKINQVKIDTKDKVEKLIAIIHRLREESKTKGKKELIEFANVLHQLENRGKLKKNDWRLIWCEYHLAKEAQNER